MIITNIIFKTAFFALLLYLIAYRALIRNDKKLERAIGNKMGFDIKKGVGFLGSRFVKYFNKKEVEIKLKRAGNPLGLSVDGFVGLKVILPLIMMLIQLYLQSSLYYLLAVTFACFFLPDFYIVLATNDRKKEIKKELPDIIDIFESAAVSGIDVGTAFNLAADYVKGKELKKELSLLSAKYAVTKDKEQALTIFSQNINMYDVDLLVLALLQDFRTGKAQDMLSSLAQEQANDMISNLEVNAKSVEYRVLIACSVMAVSVAAIIFFPYLRVLQEGLTDIFN